MAKIDADIESNRNYSGQARKSIHRTLDKLAIDAAKHGADIENLKQHNALDVFKKP